MSFNNVLNFCADTRPISLPPQPQDTTEELISQLSQFNTGARFGGGGGANGTNSAYASLFNTQPQLCSDRDFASVQLLSGGGGASKGEDECDEDFNSERDIAQFLREPLKLPGGRVVIAPLVWNTDISTADAIRVLNSVRDPETGEDRALTWKESITSGEHQNKKFHVKWPYPPQFCGSTIHEYEALFSTGSEIVGVADFVNQKLDDSGSFYMTFKQDQLQASMPKSMGIDWSQPFHIMPYKVDIVEEDSNLPVEYDVRLTAYCPTTYPKQACEWSTPRGAHTYGSAVHKGAGHFHHRVAPKHHKLLKSDNLFSADPISYNCPDFSRWINIDRKELLEELQELVDPDDPQYVLIACPQKEDVVEPSNVLQFLVLDERKKINKLSQAKSLTSIMITTKSSGEEYFRVGFVPLVERIKKHTEHINRNKMLMTLHDLRLTLSPLHQKTTDAERSRSIGKVDLDEIAKRVKNIPVAYMHESCRCPHYTGVIKIWFGVYQHPDKKKRKTTTTTVQGDDSPTDALLYQPQQPQQQYRHPASMLPSMFMDTTTGVPQSQPHQTFNQVTRHAKRSGVNLSSAVED
jgi:hypothetical protein